MEELAEAELKVREKMSIIDFNTIELKRMWMLGPAMAQGGFGSVFEATDENGWQAVVKLVRKEPSAARELLFEPLSDKPNIIPIVDSGEWRNFYVLVMPRAEKSLRQHLNAAGGKLTTNESLDILIDVAEALASLEKDVVHRDLKPENILFYQGHWCLADFGIARYAEATTAPDTRKHLFTYPYAAPEQWRHEHATPPTDVYAFGVTAFEVLQGHWPFPGPDFREQHLHQAPPRLTSVPLSIDSLVTECLYKPPEARPTPVNILTRLRRSQQPSSPAAASLQVANQIIVEKQAQAGAIASAQKSTEERRSQLLHAARQSFKGICERLIEQIREAAPAAAVAQSQFVYLGDGSLLIKSIQPAPLGCLVASGGLPIFDVIAYTEIAVQQPRDRFDYEGRSHSLWFCDAHDEGVYRWFETAFMIGVWIPQRSTMDPFALSPTDKMAAHAFAPGSSDRQVEWEPLPFDQGDEEQFIERWLRWFAQSAQRTLRLPPSMPENSGGRHRRLS
jgi:serine/threonine-protein kinase